MNRLGIREAVRDILGEQHEGFWTDDELNRYIQLACNRHAQQALSVSITQNTTSLPGIQEYVLPPYFGEMRRVRWHTDTQEVWTLHNAPKTDIINRNGSEFLTLTGEPRVFYYDAGRIGLYPIPNKKALLSYEPPSNQCENWREIAATRDPVDDTVEEIYSKDVYIQTEDTCGLFCSHVSLWMRRNARPTPGGFRLRIQPVGRPDYEYWFSRYINTKDLAVEQEWVNFDFTHAPVELLPDVDVYNFSFIPDQDFLNIARAAYGNDGPQFAVEGTGNLEVPYYQFHQYKQDIELDFYRNEVDAIDTDQEDLEMPDIYHRTIVKMVIARALRKGSRDLENALYWEAEASKEIQEARAQAVLRTRGRMVRTEGAHRYYGPDATVVDGFWRIRAW
jgi:hypothetical protein